MIKTVKHEMALSTRILTTSFLELSIKVLHESFPHGASEMQKCTSVF